MRTQLTEDFVEDILFNDKIARFILARYPQGPYQLYAMRILQAKALRQAYGDRDIWADIHLWERKRQATH